MKKIANTTVRTRKHWNRKTALKLYFSVVSGVTKQIVLPETYKISFFCEMGLFTLHNYCVSWLFKFLKLKLHSQSCFTIPEFSGYHCKSAFNSLKTAFKLNKPLTVYCI